MNRSRVAVALVTMVALSACSEESTPPVGPPAAVGPVNAIIIAHRGASFDAPEHTLAAYDLAIEQGADYIELDVARTRDSVLVVIHDATAARTLRGPSAECSGRIADRTFTELSICDAGSWFNAAFPSRGKAAFAALRMPALEEVITRYADRTRFYIEIKDPDLYPGIESDLAVLLAARGISGGLSDGLQRVYIQSFSSASLRRMKALAPGLPVILAISALSSATVRDSASSISDFADGIAPRWESTDAAVVSAAHARCLAVYPYTVDDDQQVQFLLELGVDGVFTNRPRFLRLALEISRHPRNHFDLCGS